MHRVILKEELHLPQMDMIESGIGVPGFSGIPYAHSVQTIHVPYGARPLASQIQRQRIVVWYEGDANEERDQSIVIHAVGTGTDDMPPENARYIDTVQLHGYVWHIYWEPVK